MSNMKFDKPPESTRIVVAMSGGVDSSTAAALMGEQGFEVIGGTLQLYDYGAAVAKSKTCCAGQDIYDARRVAEERDPSAVRVVYPRVVTRERRQRAANCYTVECRGRNPTSHGSLNKTIIGVFPLETFCIVRCVTMKKFVP